MSHLHIRKQVYELTADDLDQHTVWEFALDEEGEEGQDEATVRPYEGNQPLNPTDGMFIVCAHFLLADGTRMQGYLTPPVQGDSSLGTLQQTIFKIEGRVSFWFGMLTPEPKQLAEIYACLGKLSSQEVFPIQLESDVELTCGSVAGQLPGFLILEEFATIKIKVVR
ncbi:hypothetical protein [Synechococcus elongatus]|uniref:Uncharacterized protein n=1 Tax=Synechococcus elongatus PCC 11802 TaxID=2283154 RepID=A0AAT9JSB4_SYNEL|nr:hypothetical protein EKO22_07420 [Synechococcus elongatus PCC 11802]